MRARVFSFSSRYKFIFFLFFCWSSHTHTKLTCVCIYIQGWSFLGVAWSCMIVPTLCCFFSFIFPSKKTKCVCVQLWMYYSRAASSPPPCCLLVCLVHHADRLMLTQRLSPRSAFRNRSFFPDAFYVYIERERGGDRKASSWWHQF